MNRRHRAGAVLMVVAACVIIAATLSHAKPAPPPQLNTIFKQFPTLEAHFKSSRWNEALKSADTISAAFDEMALQLRENIKSDITAVFGVTMSNLRQSILRKDIEKTGVDYISAQKLFFIIAESYEYKVPPALPTIDKCIDEAEEALRRHDFKRVAGEMDEVREFFYRVEPLLRAKGARYADIEQFETTVREVRAAENRQAAQAGIRTLKKLSATFLAFF